jgi:hypothetical protein
MTLAFALHDARDLFPNADESNTERNAFRFTDVTMARTGDHSAMNASYI